MKEYQFINRELSWLEFNQRVLSEISHQNGHHFESLKFASIVSSNLDEFFMIRVASVRDQILAGLEYDDISGLSTAIIMERISLRVHQMMEDLYNKYNSVLLKGLKKENILILKKKELDVTHLNYLDDYFEKNIFPVLTPMTVDLGRPFPLILNKSLNVALLVAEPGHKKKYHLATVQVPSVLGRLIELPSVNGKRAFILLEDLIKMKLDRIFAGYQILAKACYRITRNADLSINEEGAEDLLDVIEESLRKRKWGAVIRLEIENGADTRILDQLMMEFEIAPEHIYSIPGPIDLKFLSEIYSLEGYNHLLNPPIKPLLSAPLQKGENLFKIIQKGDILLHHPYHSFQTVIDLVQKAADDPQVLAIKQTLYRVSDNSPIVEALARAAENGKQVTVLLEIKARFDERNNIQWAKMLETSGCHVIYGFGGLKTHCKLLLVVRKEKDGIKRYVHLSTGNYNEVTASLYTDIGLLTADPSFGADASNLFNMLSGLSKPMDMFQLVLAPYDLREKLLRLIQQEKRNAESGKKAKIILKLNSLTDKEMIIALYEAAQAGVTIKLIVRGICCLIPELPGVSENISVVSIVGRFLEHSRIFYFYQNGDEAIYLASADLMERNLNRRVEAMYPVLDDTIKQKVKRILEVTLSDTAKMRKMLSDGTYKKVGVHSGKAVNCQEVFSHEASESSLL